MTFEVFHKHANRRPPKSIAIDRDGSLYIPGQVVERMGLRVEGTRVLLLFDDETGQIGIRRTTFVDIDGYTVQLKGGTGARVYTPAFVKHHKIPHPSAWDWTVEIDTLVLTRICPGGLTGSPES